MFTFKRAQKNKQESEQREGELTQEQIAALQDDSNTLASIAELFAEEQEAEGFDLTASVSELQTELNIVVGLLKPTPNQTLADCITALQRDSKELAQISDLVTEAEGETTLDKVKSISPERKTTTVKGDGTTDEQQADTTFQDYDHNKEAIKELASYGVRLSGVDYSKINKN